MQHTGVPASGGRAQRVIEDPFGLQHPRARRRLAGSGVPERPCGHVDQRVCRQSRHVDVIRVGPGQRRHGVGIGRIPGQQRTGVVRIRGWVAGLQRLDQAAFHRGGAAVHPQREFCAGAGQRRRQVDGVEGLPRLVVVGTDRIRDAPSCDRQVGVQIEGSLKARNGLFVVERVGPDQPAVEPQLGLRRWRIDRPVVAAQLVVRPGVHVYLVANSNTGMTRSVLFWYSPKPGARSTMV